MAALWVARMEQDLADAATEATLLQTLRRRYAYLAAWLLRLNRAPEPARLPDPVRPLVPPRTLGPPPPPPPPPAPPPPPPPPPRRVKGGGAGAAPAAQMLTRPPPATDPATWG